MRASSSRAACPTRRRRAGAVLASSTAATSRAQPLVLLQQILRELRALAEEREHLLGALAQLHLVSRSCRPLSAPGSRRRGSPDSIADAISGSGNTASTTPVRIACCGMPKITAVSSDSAITARPPRLTARTPWRPSSPMPVSTTASRSRAEVLRRRHEQPVDRGRVLVARRSRGASRVTTRRAARLELEVAAARRDQHARPARAPRRRAASRARERRQPVDALGEAAREALAACAGRPRRRTSGASRSAPRICISAGGPAGRRADRDHAQPRRCGRRRSRRTQRRAPASALAHLLDAQLRGSRGPCASAPARSSRAPAPARSVGLATKSTAPSSSALNTSSSPLRPLTTITGVGRCAIRRRRKVKPSMRGISRSSVMRSGCELERLAQRLLAVARRGRPPRRAASVSSMRVIVRRL